MPKCRACSSLLGYCHLAGILPAGGTMFGCSQGDDKNKPLLVDALAAAVEELMTPRHTSEERAVGHDLGHFALARYKEEVDHAKV